MNGVVLSFAPVRAFSAQVARLVVQGISRAEHSELSCRQQMHMGTA